MSVFHKFRTMLKKVSFAVATLALIATIFSSCKSHERCPAYGKANTEKVARV